MTDSAAAIADTRGHYRRQRSLYADDLTRFLARSPESILGLLTGATGFPVTLEQRFAWTEQIAQLRDALSGLEGRGRIYFEYAIPRLGKWIDVLLVLDHVVFVIEFKVGEAAFNRAAIDQVWDYALDLRNFHETSHGIPIAPMLVATKAKPVVLGVVLRANDPLMPEPVCAGATQIRAAITHILGLLTGRKLDSDVWERGRYQPTPIRGRCLPVGAGSPRDLLLCLQRPDPASQPRNQTQRVCCSRPTSGTRRWRTGGSTTSKPATLRSGAAICGPPSPTATARATRPTTTCCSPRLATRSTPTRMVVWER
jgi:hypothetical protein